MLTVDEQFEAIIADVAPVAKMDPFQEPTPQENVPAEQDDKPEEKKEEK